MTRIDTIDDVLALPIEEQSKFCDWVCSESVENEDFCADQLQDPKFELWNMTSVGNMALCALRAKNVLHRAAYQKMLDDYTKWRKQQKRLQCLASVVTAGVIVTLSVLCFFVV